MNELIDALVTRLEEIDLEEYVDEPELLAAAMMERAQILTALQTVDPAQLPRQQRALIRERLEAVQERDRKLTAELAELQGELSRAMEQLTYGRAAARGYANQSDKPAPQVRRIG